MPFLISFAFYREAVYEIFDLPHIHRIIIRTCSWWGSYANFCNKTIMVELNFKFEVISDNMLQAYTGGCSGSVSACCTRVCTRDAQPVNAEQWGQFLELNAGVVQY